MQSVMTYVLKQNFNFESIIMQIRVSDIIYCMNITNILHATCQKYICCTNLVQCWQMKIYKKVNRGFLKPEMQT